MFTEESLKQLEAAGEALYSTGKGIVEGRDSSDIAALFSAAMLTKECLDEIRADTDKALSYLLGSALRKHGAS